MQVESSDELSYPSWLPIRDNMGNVIVKVSIIDTVHF